MAGKRLLLAAAIAAACTAAHADEIQFNFTGTVADTGTPFALSFDVNTLDPGNTLADTFANGQLASIAVTVLTTDFTATLGGVPLASNATGDMDFAGRATVGGFSFGSSLGIDGGGAPAGVPAFKLFDQPQFAVGSASEAAIQGSADPLGLLLSGSWYGSDDPGLLFLNGQVLSTDVTFLGRDPPLPAASVPEPGTLGLFLLGLSPLFLLRRRCRRCRVPLYLDERWQGTCRPCRERALRRLMREIEQLAQERRATMK